VAELVLDLYKSRLKGEVMLLKQSISLYPPKVFLISDFLDALIENKYAA
jgi:hypothetical protein